ncbi:Translocase of outer mitochondrial membrane complex, subunit TOM22 [Phaffia rhodozyma]|uniref:Translocase of outer mitochondrial membrane complex, subunit TOM22 n=1 Tax=Phaffia rhodozyma TaxID=264483 RepID=A0A0F7SUG1_PHARH|nr:Translocase of outer mitochondrial membrane complex, subunit TOM22 [Phaffia rhodozyma]
MVKVEEVRDAHFEDNDSDYETSSSVSDDSDNISVADSDDEPESFTERIAALKDIIPPSTRLSISSSAESAVSWTKWGSKAVGNVIWVVTTTALLIGLPMALALEDENRLVAQEKEMVMQQQGQAAMAPGGQGSLVPPGF